MKHFKLCIVVMMILAVMAGTMVAHAQTGENPPPGPGPGGFGGPLRGEITDVTDTTITIFTSEGEYVVVNLNAETTVYILLTQTEGSLADLKKLTAVQVMGRPSDDGVVDARMIVITPWGDVVRGEITAVDAEQSTMTLEDRMPPMRWPEEDGATEDMVTVRTVAIDDDTQVLVDGEESLIANLTAGQFATAYGEAQGDDSLVATVIIVDDEPQGFGVRPGPGGPGPGGPGGGPGQGGPAEGGRQRPGGIKE